MRDYAYGTYKVNENRKKLSKGSRCYIKICIFKDKIWILCDILYFLDAVIIGFLYEKYLAPTNRRTVANC